MKNQNKKITIIAAFQVADRGLGKDGDLLYHIPEDLKRFRSITRDNTVIMGRKTWESLPEKVRPMPHRNNIVVTRNENYQAPGAYLAPSLEDALTLAHGLQDDIYIIGGGEIYRQALDYANQLDVTIIQGNKEADVFFPEYQSFFNKEISREEHVTPDGTLYAFVVLEKE